MSVVGTPLPMVKVITAFERLSASMLFGEPLCQMDNILRVSAFGITRGSTRGETQASRLAYKEMVDFIAKLFLSVSLSFG